MQIAAVQTSIFWESPSSNYVHLEQLLKKTDKVDLIILPEMFSTGFTMNSRKIAEENEGETLSWMKKLAKQKKAVITGSVVVEEEGNFYNRLYWVNPDNSYEIYDKKHLFRMAGENQFYSEGKKRLITEYKRMKFCPLICYDLRFPVWSRNIDQKNQTVYDCLIYVANWPEPRTDAWESLLKARAIENQSFVIGVNRIGKDGNGVTYSGGSRVFDYKGNRLDKFEYHNEQVEIINFNLSELQEFREKFPAYLDADRFRFIE